MALRCFARRHLVCARPHSPNGHLPSQYNVVSYYSTSTAVQEEKGKGVRIHGQHTHQSKKSLGSEFFSSPLPPAWSKKLTEKNKSNHQPGPSSTKHQKAFFQIPHPLIRELKDELATSVTSSSERIWRLYVAIVEESQRHYAGSTGLDAPTMLPVLARSDHRRVLRAIAPQASNTQKRRQANIRKSSSLVKYRYEAGLEGRQASGIASYLKRVGVIFEQLSSKDPANLPDIEDFNEVLEQLAPGGNIAAITKVWSALVGDQGAELTNMNRLRIPSLYSSPGIHRSSHQPNQRTYLHLMVGITRHLTDQIERVHRRDLNEWLKVTRQRKQKHKVDSHVVAVSRGNAAYGEPVSDRARQAVELASRRTASLVDDMLRRHVAIDKITCDLAMRILRLSGNLKSLKLLTKLAFRVDLDNPDVPPALLDGPLQSKVGAPDVHTLNTIVMALGEQGTVSQMIAAYEALTRPIPAGLYPEQQQDDKPEQSHLATDWKDLFGKKGQIESPDTKEHGQNVHDNTESHPALVIQPNTTTLSTLIKHACTAPDPLRMLAPLESTSSARNELKEDHDARRNGDYVNMAIYFVRETAFLREAEIKRLASELRVKTPSIDELVAQIEAQDQQRISSFQENLRIQRKDPLASETYDSNAAFVTEISGLSTRMVDAHLSNATPRFMPPGIDFNYLMIQPIVAYAARKRNVAMLRHLGSWVRYGLALHVAELQVLNAAIRVWDEQGRQSPDLSSSHLASREALHELVLAMQRQRQLIREKLHSLSMAYVDKIANRIHTLATRRRAREVRRRENRRAAVFEQEVSQQEQARLKSLRQIEHQQRREEESRLFDEMQEAEEIRVKAIVR